MLALRFMEIPAAAGTPDRSGRQLAHGLEQAPGSEINLFKVTFPGGQPIGTICFPVRDHLAAATVTALIGTDLRSWLPEGGTISHQIIQGNNLVLSRNEAVQRMQGDWLLFIDDDMVWQPDAVKNLVTAALENDLDILGGLCFRRSPPFQPTLYMREGPTSGAYNFLERWDTDIIEVDATGMAFIYIAKRAFEKMAGSEMPPLEVRETLGPPNFFRWEGTLGEDLRFCQEAKAAGLRIFVDTRIEIGHVAEITVGKREFLTQLAFREEELWLTREKVNNEMGLPTVTPAEAYEQVIEMYRD